MSIIHAARFADALYLADRLRLEDAREIAACRGLGPREGLFHCLIHSERSFALMEEGGAEALWGMSSASVSGLRVGVPWMLAAERLFDGRRAPLVRSRRIIQHLLLDHDVLTNVTDADNEAHLRWLAWCGFRLLRRHDRYGVEGRPFVEFYRINPRRDLADGAVRSLLLGRAAPAGEPSQNQTVNRLVKLGIGLLDRPGTATDGDLRALSRVLDEVSDPQAVDARLRPGCVRLLLELAVRLTNDAAALAGPRRHTPLGELMCALAGVSDVCVLEAIPDQAELAAGLDPQVYLRVEERPRPASPDTRIMNDAGSAGFQWLLRRYVRMLTLDGRVSRSQGYRLWGAAVGAGESAAMRPLGISRERLSDVFCDYRLSGSLLAAGGPALGPAEMSRSLLEGPLDPGQAMAGMRAAVSTGGLLQRAIADELDGLALAGSGPVRDGRIRTLRDLVFVASAIADRVALRALPSLRLGGVVSGYADRHWLYRLLRLRLIAAGSGVPARALIPLLIDEVSVLLAAAHLENRLAMGAGVPTAEEVDRACRDACTFWGLEQLSDDGLHHLTLWLLPVLTVPVRHVLELGPALLSWHLTVAGEVDEAVRGFADVLGEDRLGPRLGYRKFLRRMSRNLDIVTVGRHLGLMVDAEPRERAPSSLLVGRR